VVSLNLAHPVYRLGADVKTCSINQSITLLQLLFITVAIDMC